MNWIRDHFKLVAEGHVEPMGQADIGDRQSDPVFTDRAESKDSK